MNWIECLPINDSSPIQQEVAFKRDAILSTVSPDAFGIKVHPFLTQKDFLNRWKIGKPDDVANLQKNPENELLHGKVVSNKDAGEQPFFEGLQLVLWNRDKYRQSGIVVSFLEFDAGYSAVFAGERAIDDPAKFIIPDFSDEALPFDHDILRTTQLIIDSAYKNFVFLRLYERAKGHCEHPAGCDVNNHDELTIDHFTPLCIGKLIGAQPDDMYGESNLQLLCGKHHHQKDSTTQSRKGRMKTLLQGGTVDFSQKTRRRVNALGEQSSAYDLHTEEQELLAV